MPRGSGVRISSNQLPILPFDRLIAFARGFLQRFFIHYLDFAAGILDEAGALQRVRDDGHAGASYAQHLRQIFLSE